MPKNKDGLNPRQQRFVEQYLIDPNATEAAIKAGYSPKTAYSIGNENLSKPEIAAAIRAGQQKVSEKAGVTAERIIAEHAKLAFEPADKLLLETGLHIKASDKRGSLDSLARINGMFLDRTEHSGTIDFAQRLVEARERARKNR
jgi:phage terminase small subunit